VVSMPGVSVTALSTSGGSLALDSAGQAWGWGFNCGGMLGNGTTSPSTVPVAVSMPGVSFSAISAGGCFSLAIQSTSTPPPLSRPGMPQSPSAVPGNGFVTLSWGAPLSGGSPGGYSVTTFLFGAPVGGKITVPATQFVVNVTGLIADC